VLSVTAAGGSVAVTSTVASPSKTKQDEMYNTLQSWNETTASEALDLPVERMLAPPVRATEVLPAPPPPPPPPPPPRPAASPPPRACVAPSEEVCASGLNGSDCQLCSSDEGCDLLLGGFAGGGGGGACSRGLLPWSSSDTHRGFECEVDGLGALAFGCEPEGSWAGGDATGSCSARVAIGEIILQCRAEGCSFTAGSYAFGCAEISCKGLEQIEGLLLNGRVELTCLSPQEAEHECGADAPSECSIYIAGLDATVSAQCAQSRCAPPSAAVTCSPEIQNCSPDHPIYVQALASAAISLLSLSVALLLWARFGTPQMAKHLQHAGMAPEPPPSPPGDRLSVAEAGLGGGDDKTALSLNIEEGVGVGIWARDRLAISGPGEPNTGWGRADPAAELSAMLDAVRPVPTPPPVLRFEIGVSSARPAANGHAAAGAAGRSYVLSPISGALTPGETVGVLGPSGR
jgi:hypothetical protein